MDKLEKMLQVAIGEEVTVNWMAVDGAIALHLKGTLECRTDMDREYAVNPDPVRATPPLTFTTKSVKQISASRLTTPGGSIRIYFGDTI